MPRVFAAMRLEHETLDVAAIQRGGHGIASRCSVLRSASWWSAGSIRVIHLPQDLFDALAAIGGEQIALRIVFSIQRSVDRRTDRAMLKRFRYLEKLVLVELSK